MSQLCFSAPHRVPLWVYALDNSALRKDTLSTNDVIAFLLHVSTSYYFFKGMLLKRRTGCEKKKFFFNACFKGLVGFFHPVIFVFFFIQEMHNEQKKTNFFVFAFFLMLCMWKGTCCDKIQLWRIHIALWLSVQINERWPL